MTAVKPSNHVWSDAERESSFDPPKLLKAPARPRPRSAPKIDPEGSAFNGLDVNVSAAYLQMIENYIRPRITADDCKWLG
jgi:hypothetical protein